MEIQLSHLTVGRRRLVRLMQMLKFGRIEKLVIKKGEPVFNPFPEVIGEWKFASVDNQQHKGRRLIDFTIKPEITELLCLLDNYPDGTIDLIQVRYGLPYLLELKPKLDWASLDA